MAEPAEHVAEEEGVNDTVSDTVAKPVAVTLPVMVPDDEDMSEAERDRVAETVLVPVCVAVKEVDTEGLVRTAIAYEKFACPPSHASSLLTHWNPISPSGPQSRGNAMPPHRSAVSSKLQDRHRFESLSASCRELYRAKSTPNAFAGVAIHLTIMRS